MTPPLSETAFQQRIIGYAHLRQWLVMHTRPAKTEKGWRTPIIGDPGFPDLVLARQGFVWFWEVKSATGKASPAQDKWLDALGRALPNQRCERSRVVRPSDWDWIQEVLR